MRTSDAATHAATHAAPAPERATSLDAFLDEIGAHPVLSREAEAGLATRIREGDQDALDDLVRANLRFVVSVAKRYQHHGVDLDDLIAEGSLGLVRAAYRFDPDQGVKFISYAVWWIRQAILQALTEQGPVVRVPLSRAGPLRRLGHRARALEQQLGRAVSPAEAADRLGVSERDVSTALALTLGHVSLDAPVAPGAHARLVDDLPDDAGAPPDARLVEGALARTIEASLGTLRDREQRILRLYFGFDGEPKTLEEIGEILGITRERVRQLKERALRTLRESGVAPRLGQFY